MYNVITARECASAGIPRATVDAAQSCCLTRLSRGIFTVTRRCRRHEDFRSAIDDPTVLELRSALAQKKSVAGSEQLRRMEHLSVLDAYRFYKPDDVIGGTSAAIIHGIPLTLGLPPRRTRRTRTNAAGREFDARLSLGDPGSPIRVEVWNVRRTYTSRWVVRRQAELGETQRAARWQGVPVTTAPRTAIDLARIGTTLDGLVACDWLLADAAGRHGHDGRQKMRDQLAEAIEECVGLRGVNRARAALGSATGSSESVSESIALHRLTELGIADIRQQVVIRDSENSLIARVDFLAAAADSTPVVIEVDGAVKYSGYRSGESTAGNPLFKEKKREDAIRRMGYRVVRLVWADLCDLSRLRTRLREAHIAC